MIDCLYGIHIKERKKKKKQTCIAKFHVINSMIGRVPAKAAPTPIPANPASVIGVSQIRLAPCFSYSPFEIF